MSKVLNLFGLDWDDTELVAAYDKSMAKCKSEKGDSVATDDMDQKESESSQRQDDKKRQKPKWMVGDHCRSVYSEDGVRYEAEIIEISEEDGTCIVKYLGYNNEEEVSLKNLKRSGGKEARIMQKSDVLKKDIIKGDYCRVLHPEKEKMYEAEFRKVAKDGGYVVKICGYKERVTVADLYPSEGPIVRFDQEQKAKKDRMKNANDSKQSNTESSEYSSSSETGSDSDSSEEEEEDTHSSERSYDSDPEDAHPVKKSASPQPAMTPMDAPVSEEDESPLPAASRRKDLKRSNVSHGHRRARNPENFTPPCHVREPANNDGMASVLVSWYTAGYQTGYYKGLKEGRKLCSRGRVVSCCCCERERRMHCC